MTTQSKSANKLSPLKRAFLKLDELQRKLDDAESGRQEPIAIIGMGCRFPGGANSPAEFWQLLRDGVDTVGEIPADRWDVDAYFDPTPKTPGKMSTRAGAFLDQVDQFDPRFFGIAPREAISLDPQQRLLLEVAWETLENAGQSPARLKNSPTGVFVGLAASDYAQLQIRMNDDTVFDAYHASGIAHSMASGRLSYVLGLMGPSLSIDTACSSSLVAIHQACLSLNAGECRMALAGGVNLILSPANNIAFCQNEMLSTTGRCLTFADGADGFVHGEGCGIVLLKKLSDAVADGDRIDAVIRGTAVNQDGPSSGITAPNGPAQQAVISAALERGGVAPADVGYVEAHGTATPLGDPIEVQALAAVYGRGRPKGNSLRIGSVKTNVGHLSAAAGVAGLIKLVLSLKAKQLAPNLHYEVPSSHIPWTQLPLEVVTELKAWDAGDAVRIGGVSSFGFSGTNVHVVVEEAQATEATVETREPSRHVMALSAKTEDALRSLARSYAEFIARNPDARLTDIALTANSGRSHFKHRLLATSENPGAMRKALAGYAHGADNDAHYARLEGGEAPRVAFLFTGQGSQYPGMGRQLYETQSAFREALDRCDELLQPHMDSRLLDLVFGDADTADALNQTAYTQPALFALEYALAQMWRSWGVEPWIVMGHSVGEYVAACVAGILDLEQGLAIIAQRGRLMQSLPAGGKMAAVFADAKCVGDALKSEGSTIAIAAVNGPENVVISGAGDHIDAVLARLDAVGIAAEPLAVSHAFHSPLMDPILDKLEAAADALTYRPARIGFVSNLTGAPAAKGDIAAGQYWRRHAREPVQFEASIQGLYDRGIRVFLEIGPHPVLLGMARNCLPDDDAAWLPSLRRGQDDWLSVQHSLGELYLQGVDIDWAGYAANFNYQKLSLPTYPFQRQRYWIDTSSQRMQFPANAVSSSGSVHPLLHRKIDTAIDVAIYETNINVENTSWLYDHVVHQLVVFPAAACLELVAAAGRDHFNANAIEVTELTLGTALILPASGEVQLQLALTPVDQTASEFRLYARDDSTTDPSWKQFFSGRVSQLANSVQAKATCPDAGIPTGNVQDVEIDALYAGLRERGLQFGPGFTGLASLERRDGEAFGEVRSAEEIGLEMTGYRLHPAILDACIQVAAAAVPGFAPDDRDSDIYMPFGIDSFRIFPTGGAPRFSHARIDPAGSSHGETLTGHVEIYDAKRSIVAELRGMHFKRADATALRRAATTDLTGWFYAVDWKQVPGVEMAKLRTHPDRVAGVLKSRLPELAAEHGVDAYETLNRDLDAICTSYIYSALRKLGCSFEAGHALNADGLAASLRIADRHRRLFGRLLDILAEDGLLRSSGDDWIVQAHEAPPEPLALYEQLMERHADCSAELRWTHRCGAQLAEALRGDADPQELLFPGGNLALATEVYSGTPVARTLNTLAGVAVSAWLDGYPKDRPLRIVEIGAGTGGTTGYVLPELPAERCEYAFTDIGPVFLDRAMHRFADFSFVDYDPLDIEKSPLEQGFTAHQADIVIAPNVLHATVDLRATLRHVRQLLAPGGMLVLMEVTEQQRWFDVTVGLTDGWWRFKDTDLRAAHTLLDRGQWRALLAECGFTAVSVVPEGDELGSALEGQAMILARANDAADTATDEDWLVFADNGGVGSVLYERLTSSGATCTKVAKNGQSAVDAADILVDPASPEQVGQLLRTWLADGRGTSKHVAYLWALDANLESDEAVARLQAMQRQVCAGTLHMIQGLLDAAPPAPPRLCLVTRGAWSVNDDGGKLSPAQATLWGLGKAIGLEHPDMRPLLVDLAPKAGDTDDEIDTLLYEMRFQRSEDEIALRQGTTFCARLATLDGSAADHSANRRSRIGRPVQWRVPENGLLEDLELASLERAAPGPGQVEIEIVAAGVNFRDVLAAIGMRPGFESIGTECAGRIARVGDGVNGLAVGDPVVAIASGSLATHVTTSEHLVVKKPAGLSFEEAVTLPVAFLTAQRALVELGRMKRGDRVLIHAAAGGVGMAAIQLARSAGAEIFATAGSPNKRRFLESLGIEHVMDSRSLDFADHVMAITGGRGVDIVLNSLAGDYVDKGLGILAPGGRFLELGKSDIRSKAETARINDAAEYIAVDLTGDIEERPERLAAPLGALIDAVVSNDLTPLPTCPFALTDAVSAFRYMERAQHIGKVVLLNDDEETDGDRDAGIRFRDDATYLVSGGLSGLGLLVAGWLVDRGARNLILAGRSAPSDAALQAVTEMEERGARIRVALADIAVEEDVKGLLSPLGKEWPPLNGVFHAAGVLDDGILVQQDWGRFEKVMAPKVSGAWLLHCLTRGMPIEYFVLFSSVASLLGSVGQANHSAANSFLDALAAYRQERGLPGLSINWGAWSEVGAGARHHVDDRITSGGLGIMSPAEGLQALERAMLSGVAQVGVTPVDWQTFLGRSRADGNRPFFSRMARMVAESSAQGPASPATETASEPDFLADLLSAYPNKRRPLLLGHLQACTSKILGLPADEPIDRKQPLTEMGLDSLMAVELRNVLRKSLELPLPATLLFDYPTINALADYLGTSLFKEDESEPVSTSSGTDDADDILSMIEDISDDDADRLLSEHRGHRD